MDSMINNILKSKTPLMVILRYILLAAIIFMGIARLRITLILLFSPENYQKRDILQIYLMLKALLSGLSPYLSLDELASKFIGIFPFFPHPSPYPPFVVIFFYPLAWFSFSNAILIWYVIEIILLAVIAWMLVILLKGTARWYEVIISFFILLAWFPIMADLELGQLAILLTMLLLASLLALKRNKRMLAGVMIGFSIALKLITWPIIIYLILKKDWRTVISSFITALVLNLFALCWLGIKPFMEYYLQVSSRVFDFYKYFWGNKSIATIGYRLFTGTDSSIFDLDIQAPPIINIPTLAPYVTLGVIAFFLVIGLAWAFRSKDLDISFAILVNLMVTISPIVWPHYYVLLTISLVVMFQNLVKLKFPPIIRMVFILDLLLLFLSNEYIYSVLNNINRRLEIHPNFWNQSSFALISWLPLLEVVILTVLLWWSGQLSNNKEEETRFIAQLEAQSSE